jgi:hypothetical protein
MVRVKLRDNDGSIERHIESLFPNLAGSSWLRTSPQTVDYNCFAWAAGETSDVWDPERSYWPENCKRELTPEAISQAYASIGFALGTLDGCPQEVERIAIYCRGGVPQHAARQLPDGNWTSKLGASFDIEHPLHALEGSEYGTVKVILERRRQS